MIRGRHQQQQGLGPRSSQSTRKRDPQRRRSRTAGTSGRQADEWHALHGSALEKHALGDDRPSGPRCRRGRCPQPGVDRRVAFGAGRCDAHGDAYEDERGRGHLRQNAGVNSTSTDISSSLPISIAKVHTQVSKSFSVA